MAIAAFTADQTQQRYLIGAWAAMANGDTGAPLDVDPTALLSIAITAGAFGGSTLTWEASLDGGATFQPCIDIKGNAMAFNAVGTGGMGIPYIKIRPNLSGGAGSGVICRILAARGG